LPWLSVVAGPEAGFNPALGCSSSAYQRKWSTDGVDRTSAFNFCQAVSHEMAGREVIAPEGSSLADLRDAIERVSEVDILPN